MLALVSGETPHDTPLIESPLQQDAALLPGDVVEHEVSRKGSERPLPSGKSHSEEMRGTARDPREPDLRAVGRPVEVEHVLGQDLHGLFSIHDGKPPS